MAKQIAGHRLALSRRSPPSVSSLVGIIFFPVILSSYTAHEVRTECSEKSAQDIQTPGNHPKERTLRNTAKVWNEEKHVVIESDFSTATPVAALIYRVRLHCLVNLNFFTFSAYFSNWKKKFANSTITSAKKEIILLGWFDNFFVEWLATLLVRMLCNVYNTTCKPTLLLCHCDYIYKNYFFNTLIKVMWLSNKYIHKNFRGPLKTALRPEFWARPISRGHWPEPTTLQATEKTEDSGIMGCDPVSFSEWVPLWEGHYFFHIEGSSNSLCK